MKRLFQLSGLFGVLILGTLLSGAEMTVSGRIRFSDDVTPPPVRENVIREIELLWTVCQSILPPEPAGPVLVIRHVGHDRLPELIRGKNNRLYLDLPIFLSHTGMKSQTQTFITDAMLRLLCSRYDKRYAPPPGEYFSPDWLLAAVLHRMREERDLPLQSPFQVIFPVFPGLSRALCDPELIPLPDDMVCLSFPPDDTPAEELYGELCTLLLNYHFSAPGGGRPALRTLLQKCTNENRNSIKLYRLIDQNIPLDQEGNPIAFRDFALQRIFNQTLHLPPGESLKRYRELAATPATTDSPVIQLWESGIKIGKITDLKTFKQIWGERFNLLKLQSAYYTREGLGAVEREILLLNIKNAPLFAVRLKTAENKLAQAVAKDEKINAYLDKLERWDIPVETHLRRQRRILCERFLQTRQDLTKTSLFLDAVENYERMKHAEAQSEKPYFPTPEIKTDSSLKMLKEEQSVLWKKS